MPDPRTDRKFRRPKPEPQEPAHEVLEAFLFPQEPARKASLSPPLASRPATSSDDARSKAADTFALRKYGLTRREFGLAHEYHEVLFHLGAGLKELTTEQPQVFRAFTK
jgi:hypothetical protein